MWKASGGDKSQQPFEWLRLPVTERFVAEVTRKFKTGKIPVLKTVKGRYGGNYAHWQIALAYAKYLSPEFHIWANEVLQDRYVEIEDPEKGLTRKIHVSRSPIDQWPWDRFMVRHIQIGRVTPAIQQSTIAIRSKLLAGMVTAHS